MGNCNHKIQNTIRKGDLLHTGQRIATATSDLTQMICTIKCLEIQEINTKGITGEV